MPLSLPPAVEGPPLKHRLQVLGVNIDGDRLQEVYEEFLKLADRKRTSTTKDRLVCW
jgi:2-isopropylmalate synthase